MIFYRVKKWWDHHGWGVIFFGSLIALFLLWLFYSRHRPSGTSNASWDQVLRAFSRPSSVLPRPDPFASPPAPRMQPTDKTSSKGERACKEFMEYITGKPFQKIRPPWMTNPVTNQPLELDLYNEELRLAVEYNGSQHYQFNSMMHPTRDSFHNQKYRDLLKQQLCERQGVRLIHVPYTVPHDKIPGYLYDRLKALQVI